MDSANTYKSLYLQEEAIRRQDKIECVALKQLLENEKEEHKKTKAMLLKARRKSTILGERLRKRKIRNIAELKTGSGGCKCIIQKARYVDILLLTSINEHLQM